MRRGRKEGIISNSFFPAAKSTFHRRSAAGFIDQKNHPPPRDEECDLLTTQSFSKTRKRGGKGKIGRLFLKGRE
jgi:hypothetical protein